MLWQTDIVATSWFICSQILCYDLTWHYGGT